MRIENFRAWEARQEVMFEFDRFEPVAMSSGSLNHSSIQRNLAIAVGGRLRSTRCAFHGSDLKLLTGTQSRYPDGQVLCGPMQGGATFATSPAILFEVVSPSSESIDRVDKLTEYCRIASVSRYIILEQDQVSATVLVREGDGWTTSQVAGQAMLSLPEVGIEFPLDELYEGVEFPAAPSSSRSAATAAQQAEASDPDPE